MVKLVYTTFFNLYVGISDSNETSNLLQILSDKFYVIVELLNRQYTFQKIFTGTLDGKAKYYKY